MDEPVEVEDQKPEDQGIDSSQPDNSQPDNSQPANQETDNPETDEQKLEDDLVAKPGHEKIIDIIVKKDDVTWKTIILELVNSDRMDPWNIDIKLLTKEYLNIIKHLNKHDFRVSGKIILAAALLLKLKSVRLLTGDLNELDRLFTNAQETEDDDDLGMVDEILPQSVQEMEAQKLIPRTPQARKRKVSVYDLVEALEKALEVKERRLMRRWPSLEVEVPKKKVDVTVLMDHLHEKIVHEFGSKERVFFEDLIPGESKEDKVVTFIPLLHLTNLRKIDIDQDLHFGPIEIQLRDEDAEIPEEKSET